MEGEMASTYFGEPNMGSARASGSSSSRKGKKSNSDKPKQPQRGLGVAQLEKLRLHGQMAYGFVHSSPLHNPCTTNEDLRSMQSAYSSVSSSPASYGFHPNIVMVLGDEYERTNMGYSDSQPTNTTRWETGNSVLETQLALEQPGMTRHFLNQHVEDSQYNSTMGSNSQIYSESSDSQEPDLELRLSL